MSGGKLEMPDGLNRHVPIQTRPRPVQPALDCWTSAFINPQTFWDAGAVGTNVLCSVFGQVKLPVYSDSITPRNLLSVLKAVILTNLLA